jgi:hypothetical protein
MALAHNSRQAATPIHFLLNVFFDKPSGKREAPLPVRFFPALSSQRVQAKRTS